MDDNKDILRLYKMALEEEGYKVDTVSTGRDAITNIRLGNYDLAILDIIMDDITGDDVAEELREIDNSVKIIFITAYSRIQDKIEGLNQGVSRVLIKPITIEELKHAVKLALISDS